jgi:hypothetical protein
MSKKELRKNLEATLSKLIENALIAEDSTAGKKISKTIRNASKDVAKKFYKAVSAAKHESKVQEKSLVKTAATKTVAKAAVKKSPVKAATKKVTSARKKK